MPIKKRELPLEAADHVRLERRITIPSCYPGVAIIVEAGADGMVTDVRTQGIDVCFGNTKMIFHPSEASKFLTMVRRSQHSKRRG